MLLPWFQVDAGLAGHRKIGKLRDALGLKERYEAVGLLVCLWCWAAVHAPSGDLEDISAQDLADACGWRKNPKKLRDALVASGLVDEADGKLRLHDWDDHQGMFQDALSRARRKNADRQKAYRERRRQEREAQRGPATPGSDHAPRNAMRNVTGTITGDENNGPTSSSTRTITLPVSKSAVVGNSVHSDGDGGDRDRDTLRLIGGEVGQDVLLLTDRQMDDLLEKLGLDGFNAYGKRLVSWVQRKQANVDHYREILKWAKEDGVLTDGPELLWGGGT